MLYSATCPFEAINCIIDLKQGSKFVGPYNSTPPAIAFLKYIKVKEIISISEV
jgi:hypothetical protein